MLDLKNPDHFRQIAAAFPGFGLIGRPVYCNIQTGECFDEDMKPVESPKHKEEEVRRAVSEGIER